MHDSLSSRILAFSLLRSCLTQRGWLALCCWWLISALGCSAIIPSNDRQWAPELAQLPQSQFQGDQVLVRNIRNCSYRTLEDFEVRYYDQVYDLRELQTVDLIVVPFRDIPDIAHIMTSYGFRNGQYVCISVEIRREQGEEYDPLKGFFNQYELMYVVGDERDFIMKRTNLQLDEVFLYPIKVSPAQARKMFVSMLERANKLAESPEFYNTLTNNCTTNVVWHVNQLSPNLIRYSAEVLLPAHSPEVVYNLGLLDKSKPFEQIKAESRVNPAAFQYRNDPNFSQLIRRR
jgi:hypothetical protein